MPRVTSTHGPDNSTSTAPDRRIPSAGLEPTAGATAERPQFQAIQYLTPEQPRGANDRRPKVRRSREAYHRRPALVPAVRRLATVPKCPRAPVHSHAPPAAPHVR